ncbi:MAG TPA: NAD(P)-dependent oxidoreductase [Candidatus Omnitrophota bacterium]|nr:NAD(P)-dependent oxidoreductase [Candidatus Omnitrophota bacterium]
MKIAFFEMKEKWEEDYIKKNLKGHQLSFFEEELDKFDISKIKDFDIISIFIYSNVTREILSKFNCLKAIITRSTGFDHVDLKACSERKIKVYNVPRYGSNTVAEYTFALLLNLVRKIIPAWERARKINFDLTGLRGEDIKGKTLGIVGLGEIGKYVAEIANGFGMKILVFTRTKDAKLAHKFGFRYVPYNYLLKNSDFITFHVPLTPQTKHMLNQKNISMIKKGAILINTSRGEIIETEAIIKALDKGILSAAGLDVLEAEEEIKDERGLFSRRHSRASLEGHRLLKRENVIVTPHNAFNTKEALQRILGITIEDVNYSIKNKKENLCN